MRIAYLECFSGMSGDMFLGALVDAGVPPRVLQDTVAALEASTKLGASLEVSRVGRSGISATKVDVYVDGEKDLPREECWAREERAHSHEHSSNARLSHEHQGHSHSRPGETRTGVSAPHEQPPHETARSLTEIREIICAASISEGAMQ